MCTLGTARRWPDDDGSRMDDPIYIIEVSNRKVQRFLNLCSWLGLGEPIVRYRDHDLPRIAIAVPFFGVSKPLS